MAVNKSYRYRVVDDPIPRKTGSGNEEVRPAGMPARLDRIQATGGSGVIMELEGIRTDPGTAGAFEAIKGGP